MGHEVVIFGSIEGADPERLRALNLAALGSLPAEDEWPWLIRGMFALPAEWPQGTYRSQVIHFGASLKDEPEDRSCWDRWLSKFEALLRRLYWWTATLHLVTEFEPERVFRWRPDAGAVDRMISDPPQPVEEWQRSVTVFTPTKSEPTA
jgi:hypothetical protein